MSRENEQIGNEMSRENGQIGTKTSREKGQIKKMIFRTYISSLMEKIMQ